MNETQYIVNVNVSMTMSLIFYPKSQLITYYVSVANQTLNYGRKTYHHNSYIFKNYADDESWQLTYDHMSVMTDVSHDSSSHVWSYIIDMTDSLVIC